MSVAYQAVGWNRQKKIYDLWLGAGVLAYLAVFLGAGALIHPNATAETLLIRGLGTLAFLLLHVILSIGPLARLNPKFLPLLYNRRHLGVTMFGIALCHGLFSLIQFHALGDLPVLESLLRSNTRFGSLVDFPFELPGVVALIILFVMAATSHDFWLKNLTAPVWKAMHMMVYAAYVLLVAHVALGALQSEQSVIVTGLFLVGVTTVTGLHLAASRKDIPTDRELSRASADGYVAVCEVDDIQECRAKVVTLGGERVAVFRYDGKISAISNVCQHQNGPLGEGRILDGCVTCPWHGYQYRPHDGASPPPFAEKVPTFRVKIRNGEVLVHPSPALPGTPQEPAQIGAPEAGVPA